MFLHSQLSAGLEQADRRDTHTRTHTHVCAHEDMHVKPPQICPSRRQLERNSRDQNVLVTGLLFTPDTAQYLWCGLGDQPLTLSTDFLAHLARYHQAQLPNNGRCYATLQSSFELEVRPSFPMHISCVPMLDSLAGPCSGGLIQDGSSELWT